MSYLSNCKRPTLFPCRLFPWFHRSYSTGQLFEMLRCKSDSLRLITWRFHGRCCPISDSFAYNENKCQLKRVTATFVLRSATSHSTRTMYGNILCLLACISVVFYIRNKHNQIIYHMWFFVISIHQMCYFL